MGYVYGKDETSTNETSTNETSTNETSRDCGCACPTTLTCRSDAPAEDLPGGGPDAIIDLPRVDAVEGTYNSSILGVRDETDGTVGDCEEVVVEMVNKVSM